MPVPTTYSELKTEVGLWLMRPELTDAIPTFIGFCEAQVNRRLRHWRMEASVTTTLSAGQSSLTLPSDFLELTTVSTNVYGQQTLSLIEIDALDPYLLSEQGVPQAYTLKDGALMVYPAAAAAYTLAYSYLKKVPALTTVEPTNWLLTSDPDIYLYGACREAAPFLWGDERMALWETQFERRLEALNITAHEGRYSGTPLVQQLTMTVR